MPLGILSVVQTRNALNDVDQTTLEGVAGTAMQAVRDQIDLINEAQISARVMAAVLTQGLNSDTACVDRVAALARSIPKASLVAYIPLSGLMTCSSTGRVFDFKDNRFFQELIADPLPKVLYNPHGPVSETAVIGVSHPVFDDSGAQQGIVVVSLPYLSVAPSDYIDSVARWQPYYLATFRPDGEVLLSSDPSIAPDSVLPGGIDSQRLSLIADHPAFLDAPGGRRILSVVKVTRDLYLLSVWKRDEDSFWARTSDATPYLLPVLTWIAALVAAAFASSRLVVRHVRALARSMTNYVSTKQRLQLPDMSDAPSEIQRLHAAYEGMIKTIELEEAELQNLVVDKDMLLREVNHRSGNSLQIIASVMRMYRREATDQKLRVVLDGLINRVIALSSTHTSLYALSGQRDVAMDVVLTNVIKRLKEIHGVALGVASKRFQPIRMDSDAAIPLALAMAEAVGCYFSRPGLARDSIIVSLSEEAGAIRLGIDGPEVPELRPETVVGLSSLPQRMLRQYAAQLSGTVNIRLEGDRAAVDLIFPKPKTRTR